MSNRSLIRKAAKLNRSNATAWWRGQAFLKFQKWLRNKQKQEQQ